MNQRGGLKALLFFVVLTLLGVAGTVFFIIGSYQKNQPMYQRKALQLSEYGLLEALQQLQQQPSWKAGFERTPYRDGWFRVVVTAHDSLVPAGLTLVSEGHSGTLTRRQICELRLQLPDSVWIQQSLRQE
jgi:hypothetical protein